MHANLSRDIPAPLTADENSDHVAKRDAASRGDGAVGTPRRLNFNVSEKAYNELASLAKKTHRSMTEIVRLGVGLAKIILEAEEQGGRLIITNSKGDPIKEIVLPG
jgi:hypothetical protein